MKIRSTVSVAAALLLAGISLAVQAQAPLPAPVLQAVQVPVNRARVPGTGTGPVFVRYILIDPGNADPVRDGFTPLERTAVLALYIGGDGTLNLGAGQVNTGSPNTVARNRYHIAAEGFVVAVVDAANDFNLSPIGLSGRRLGPVQPPADGLVLMSSLTGDPANPTEDLSQIDLESITGPALIVSHQGDVCAFTNPADSKALRKRFAASERAKFRDFNGGSAPLTDPCDPLAPHGFFGIDQKVVDAITKWIKRRED